MQQNKNTIFAFVRDGVFVGSLSVHQSVGYNNLVAQPFEMANILIQCGIGAHGAPTSTCHGQIFTRVLSHGNHGAVICEGSIPMDEDVTLSIVRANIDFPLWEITNLVIPTMHDAEFVLMRPRLNEFFCKLTGCPCGRNFNVIHNILLLPHIGGTNKKLFLYNSLRANKR